MRVGPVLHIPPGSTHPPTGGTQKTLLKFVTRTFKYLHIKYTIDMKKIAHFNYYHCFQLLSLFFDFVQVVFQNFIKHSQNIQQVKNSLSACHFYAKIVSNFY